jgi:GH24 family phage-related lysozyme (muramidase)
MTLPTADYKPSRKVTLFVACREALVTVAYPDPTPENCSAGFGTQVPGMKPGTPVTIRWAFDNLHHGLVDRASRLSKRIFVPLLQHQFDALLSLYYQSGNHYMPLKPREPGDKHYGDPDVLALINAGELAAAADIWPTMDESAAGISMAGLRKRRLLEQGIFLHAEYGDLTKIPYWAGNPKTTKMQTYRIQPGDLP